MRRSFLFFTFIFLINSTLFAQIFRFGVPNLEADDMARFRFGFSLGIDIVDANIKTLDNYKYPKNISPEYEVLEIFSTPTPAFNVGIVANMRMGDYFDLRFIPAFSIAHDINLNYQFAVPIRDPNPRSPGDKTLILRKIQGHYINLPLFIKFKSSRMHNVRIYAMGGGQIGINVMPETIISYDHYAKADVIPIIKPVDIQAKGGFGFDFYTTFFKLSTEFKISFGVINMLQDPELIKNQDQVDYYRNSPIIQGIQSLKSKTFTISIIIE